MEEINGNVWKFADNIDTDAIVPGQYLDAPIDEIVKHVFESINPKFVAEVKSGDIIVGGKNFGCGSSRENAPEALKKSGIACVIAESFARIFFRNAIAIGLPVVICRDASNNFAEGEQACVNLDKALIENTTKGIKLSAVPLHDEIIAIINKGGIVGLLKEMQSDK